MARLIRPQRGGFGLDSPTARTLIKPLSSEPVTAHGNFAAGIYAAITNPASRWGGLKTPDPDLNRWPPFADWLDRQAAKVMNSFSPSMSSFYPASYQAYADICAFGNAAGYDELDLAERRFIDVTISLAQVVVALDAHGRVIEILRKFHLTPRQAVREFKDRVPAKVRELAEKGSQDKHAWYHHVLPNDDFVPRSLGPRGKPWLSLYVCEVENTLVKVKGYDTMPFYFPRWDVDSGMTYGTGPGFVALASARANHLMDDAKIRAAQFAADPTKLAPDRNAIPLNGVFRPGSTIYGGVNVRGEPMVRNMEHSANIGLTMEEQRAKQEAIKDAFMYSVMSLTGRTGISDEENRVIEEAKLRNWAPHADRIMEEYAARKFSRRYDLLLRNGQIEPVPQGTPEGTVLQVHYQTAAAMALRASEAGAVRRYVADLLPVINVKPELADRLSADDYAEILHEMSPALPQRLLVSREQADADRQARAQQMQAMQAMQMAEQGGRVVRDVAGAAGQVQGGQGQ
ncbi:portal protein [Seohaeicola zhoushanensis]